MNDYFNSSSYEQSAGVRARVIQLNQALEALEDGFDVLPDEDDVKRGLINYGTVGGSANAVTVTLSYVPTSYTDGMEVIFKCPGTNTGAATINVNGLGAKSIVRQDGATLVAGDLSSGHIRHIRYNATTDEFEVMGTFSGTAGTMSIQNASAVAITGGTISGVTLSSVTLNGNMSGSMMLDEDDFNSDSDTKPPSQQSVKAYVDDQIEEQLRNRFNFI